MFDITGSLIYCVPYIFARLHTVKSLTKVQFTPNVIVNATMTLVIVLSWETMESH